MFKPQRSSVLRHNLSFLIKPNFNYSQISLIPSCGSVSQFSHSVVSNSLGPHGLQHTRPLSINNSRSLLKLMSIESLMPSNHLNPCCPCFLPPSIFPSIRIFSNESVLADQFRSVAQSCPTLCDPMNHSTPGLPVHHQLPEFTQTHVH